MKVKLCEALLLDCYCKFMSHRTVCDAQISALFLLGKMLPESPPERWEVHQMEVPVAEEGMVQHVVPGWLQAAGMLQPWRRHTQENTAEMKSHWMLQQWDLLVVLCKILSLVFKENISKQRCVKRTAVRVWRKKKNVVEEKKLKKLGLFCLQHWGDIWLMSVNGIRGRNHIEQAVLDRQVEENPCDCRQLESDAQQDLNPGTQTLDIL